MDLNFEKGLEIEVRLEKLKISETTSESIGESNSI